MKKLFRNTLFISVIALTLTACNKTEDGRKEESKILYTPVDTYKYTYGNIDENTFPISGWVAPTAKWNCNTEEQYKLLSEAGLTSIYSLYEQYIDGSNNDEIYKALANAEKYNVNYVVRDATLWHVDGEAFKERFESRHYTDYKSFAGFMYTDEPFEERFEEIKTAYDKFNTYIGGNKLFYVNLNSMYAFGENHERYLAYNNAFKSTVGLPFLSYDYYACTNEFPHVRSSYFDQLDLISRWSLENKTPFWSFALSTAHSFKNSETYYRAPHAADIYWQVNTAIAYGAKGLTYFCYQIPHVLSGNEVYLGKGGSFIDENGQTTEVYTYGQNINNFVHSIDHIIMNSTLAGMLKHETGKVGAPLKGNFSESLREIVSLESNDDILVSVMIKDGTTVCYCVNTSLENDATFSLNFIDEFNFNYYQMGKNVEQQKTSKVTNTLKPGEAMLVELLKN